MELKPITGAVSCIKPQAFNRTNMELKLFKYPYCYYGIITFNRTNMELKRIFKGKRKSLRRLLIAPIWN